MEYDPNWTMEQAFATVEEHGIGHGSPWHRWINHRSAADLEAQYKSGDKAALIEAIYMCANAEIPLLQWIEKAFRRGYQQVLSLNLQSNSWDDVFGKPLPKGSHLNALKKHRNMRPVVWGEVRKLINAGIINKKGVTTLRPIDSGLFEEVGKKLGLGKTLTEDLYYEFKNNFLPKI